MFKGLEILIVDDIFVNRMLLIEIAENLEANYSEARNGKEAIEWLKIKKFDVVFMDIEMPVMNGFETTRFIRKQMQKPICDMPILAITAHNTTELNKNFVESGFTLILSKPYTLEKIERALMKILNKE